MEYQILAEVLMLLLEVLMLLLEVLMLLLAAVVILYLFRRLRLPPVLGYLAVGVVAGPVGLEMSNVRTCEGRIFGLQGALTLSGLC